MRWYNKNQYTRIGSDVSVTELLRPPRINHLINRHGRVQKTEPSKIVPSLMGNGIHDQLQRMLRRENTVNSGSWLIERRLLAVVDGVRISGRFDALHELKNLYDIKLSKAYKFIKGDTVEWEQQLNMYDYMLWLDGYEIESLKILFVVSDFNKGESWSPNYPPDVLNIIDINKWPRVDQVSYISDRVQLWKETKDLVDDDLPLCSPKERWANASIFKLFRTPDMKKANKTFPTRARADAYLKVCVTKDPDKWGTGLVRELIGEPFRRCSWCDASAHCNQFINKLES